MTLFRVLPIALLLCACGSYMEKPKEPAPLVGVMIDNHEDARQYQRGLEKAAFVQEQLVEGFMTRFVAVFSANDLPNDVGPIRSVRPYFVDGTNPVLSALFHVGGSPDGLQRLKDLRVTSFNAISGIDPLFSYHKEAPAPHHRFIGSGSLATLIARQPFPAVAVDGLFPRGPSAATGAAMRINIDYRNRVHNLSYAYDAKARSYVKENNGTVYPPSPRNLLVLETDVEVLDELGRLAVDMNGGGAALLFRDGTVQKGAWAKKHGEWFSFSGLDGTPLAFQNGQVWMLVLDDLRRVVVPAQGGVE